MYDVLFVFVQDIIDSKSTIYFLTQLIILLGKYIHVKKWAKAKPTCEHFIKEIKQYGTTLHNIRNRKAKKTYEALSRLNVFIFSPA